MAHVYPDFKRKQALKEAVARGETVTLDASYYLFKAPPRDGKEYVSGPAERHTWYAEVTLKDGKIISVK